MIIETNVGKYELLKDHKESFNRTQFEERYVDVAFDRYTYLVGDVSAGILRIKGFSQDAKSTNGYKFITDYLNESCNMNCGYFVLKRVKMEKEKNEKQKKTKPQATKENSNKSINEKDAIDKPTNEKPKRGKRKPKPKKPVEKKES